MESYNGGTEARSPNEDLVRIADELLEHTRALRRQHEELRDALAGISVIVREDPVGGQDSNGDHDGGPPSAIQAIVLQMALAGETRDSAKDQLNVLGAEDADALVDEVFDRTDAKDSGQRRRFSLRR